MRIGEVARRTGLSARMIRYYQQQGRLHDQRDGPQHRQFTERDVHQLSILRALLAAGIDPARAVQVLHGQVGRGELEQVHSTLLQLTTQARDAISHLEGRDDAASPAEERMSLPMDIYMVRTRVATLLSDAMRPSGVSAADYALLSLLVMEDHITPSTLTRLVGKAPSTVAGQLARLVERGWLVRRSNPNGDRSWLIELTPLGRSRFRQAYPYFDEATERINNALRDRGVSPQTVRATLLDVSRILRELLSDPTNRPVTRSSTERPL